MNPNLDPVKRTQIHAYLTRQQRIELRTLAAKHDMSMAKYINRVMIEHLREARESNQ